MSKALRDAGSRRGHRFCRYADDCNLLALDGGGRAGHGVGDGLPGRSASAQGQPAEERRRRGRGPPVPRPPSRHGGRPGIGRKSLARVKHRLRAITRRNRGIPFARVIEEVNRFAPGWVTYYRHAQCQSTLRALDGWLRRTLRCVRLTHCKRPQTMIDFLRKHRVPEEAARKLASSEKGWWRLADSRDRPRPP